MTREATDFHCPNSTDAGGRAANHDINGGGCTICDRSVAALHRLHGLPALTPQTGAVPDPNGDGSLAHTRRHMAHDNRHHIVYDCTGEQHKQVHETLRAVGVQLVEAGPESFYARDVQTRQRSADADQYARARTEVHRLRASIVNTLRNGDLTHIREALTHAERLDWDWYAHERKTTA